MKGIYIDSETRIVDECYALVYAPRRQRDRFPENCVQVMPSAAEALAGADPDRKRYAAKVLGPARSSEGLRLYYLIAWLE
jgi:hypothetical protein